MRDIKHVPVPSLVELEYKGYKFTKRAGSENVRITMPNGETKVELMNGTPLTKEYANRFIFALGEDKQYANDFAAKEAAKAERERKL